MSLSSSYSSLSGLQANTSGVQVVDYGSPSAPQHFTESVRNTGFGVIANHPLAPSLIRQTYDVWANFFLSDQAVKDAFTYTQYKALAPKGSACQAGYFPFKSENAKGYDLKDLKEFYHYYPWGVLPPGTEDLTVKTFEMLQTLAKEILSWIEENTPDAVRAGFYQPLPTMADDSDSTVLRILHYPPVKADEASGALRAAPHEDINLITLLPFSDQPGLQLRDAAGKWHDVPHDPGMIAINIGDMLNLASGGYYPSTPHRVINPPSGENISRFSMPLFLHPNSDVRLSENHTADSYLLERLRELGLAS